MTHPSWWTVCLLALLAAASCARSHEQASDGKSNWLTSCEDDRGCDPEDACMCGVCTLPCSGDRECARPSGPSAVCVDPHREGIASACAAAALDDHAGICFAGCDHSSDCAAGQHCMDGACLRASTATGAWMPAARDAGGGTVTPRANDAGSVAPAEGPGPLAPSTENSGVVATPDDGPPVPTPPPPIDMTDSGGPPAADAAVPDIDAGPPEPPFSITDASAPPGLDAGVSVTPCTTIADATWSEPSVLAVMSRLGDTSVVIDRESRTLATWVGWPTNPDTGEPEYVLQCARHTTGAGWSVPETLRVVGNDGRISGAKTVLNDEGVGFVTWMEFPNGGYAGQLLTLRHDGTNWVGSPIAVDLVSSDWRDNGGVHPYVGLGVDAVGNAWLVWRPDDTEIRGAQFTASTGTWSAPVVLAAGPAGPGAIPKHPAQQIFVNGRGDAVLYWNTPTDYWARYFRDGTWWGARSVPYESDSHAFAFGEDGVGIGWFTEATGDPGDPYRGRIRRFLAETGWDDGFATPHRGYYRFQHYLTSRADGAALGVFGDQASQWTAFEVAASAQATQQETIILASDEPTVMPEFDTNQHDALVQHPSGHAFVGLGLEWASDGGPTVARQTWGRRYCASTGWGEVERLSGTLEADVVMAAAINEHGQAVALLGGSTNTLWATHLE